MTKQELIDFEAKVAQLWEAGKINAPMHLSGGNEDQLIEIFKEIKPHDYVFSTHRNHYHALLHGVPADALLAEILGQPGSWCGGRARSMGFIDRSRNFYSSAIVGGCCAVAVGVAWALQRQKREDPLGADEHAQQRHVWCFVGDGAVDGGHFWEALQYAEGQNLPITFVVEDNNRATCTNLAQRMGQGIYSGVPGTADVAVRWKISYSRKVCQYYYDSTYPHVGTGKYVQF